MIQIIEFILHKETKTYLKKRKQRLIMRVRVVFEEVIFNSDCNYLIYLRMKF